MATLSEARGTWNHTVGVKLAMDEAIDILTPDDVPLQQFLPSVPTDSIKVEWMEESLLPQAVTVVTGDPSAEWDPATSGTVTFSDVTELRVGDVLQEVGAAVDKQWVVDSVDTANDQADLSVFGTGTHFAPTDASTLQIVGQYLVEGADPKDPRSLERTAKYNVTQIGQESVQATRTQRKRAMYALEDTYDHEVEKKFRELAIRFERSLALGQRVVSGDSKQRMMGGLFYFITTTNSSGVKANLKTLIDSLIRSAYDNGGPGDYTLMVSPTIKGLISAAIDPTLRRWNMDQTKGGYVVDDYMSDFGTVHIRTNRHFPKTKGALLAPGWNTQCVYDGYFHELLAKTGDSDKGQIVGEKSLKVKNEAGQGVLTVTDA